jgi:hypothetical protein
MPKSLRRYQDDRRITDSLPARTVARRIEKEREREENMRKAGPAMRASRASPNTRVWW